MKQSSIYCTLASCALVGMVACGRNIPSDQLGQNIIEGEISKTSGGNIKLARFEKTNGQATKSFDGAERYVLEYRANIVFTNDCKWLSNVHDAYTFATVSSDTPTYGNIFFEFSKYPGNKSVKKGQQEVVIGKLNFALKEKGWEFTGHEFVKQGDH